MFQVPNKTDPALRFYCSSIGHLQFLALIKATYTILSCPEYVLHKYCFVSHDLAF